VDLKLCSHIGLRVIILLLGQLTLLSAQPLAPRFENFSMEEGLSQRFVLEVLVDCKGFLWVATEDGLNKYDGYDFKTFKHDPADPNSLGGNILRQALESHAYGEHHMWVCTVGGGLSRLDLTTERFTNYVHNPNDSTSIANNSVWIVEETLFNGIPEIWVGVMGRGLDRLDPRTGKFKHYKPGSTVTDLFYDSQGVLWVGTGGKGVGHYNPETDDITFYTHNPEDSSSLADRGIWDMTEDRFGNLWIGTFGSLDLIIDSQYKNGDVKFSHFFHDPMDPNSFSGPSVEYLFEDSPGNLWVATFGGGLNILNRDTDNFSHYIHNPDNPFSIGANSIYSIAEDHSGTLWFGHQNGISKWDSQKAPFKLYDYVAGQNTGLGNKWITSVISTWENDEEILWLATVGKGVCRFNRDTGETRWFQHDRNNPNSLADNSVLSMMQPNDKTLFFVTWGGLSQFDIPSETFQTHYLYPNPESDYNEEVMMTSHLGPTGRVWVGVMNHIAEFDFKANRLKSIDNTRAYALHETIHNGKSYLWGGSFNFGLVKFDLEDGGETWYLHDPEDSTSISDNMIEALFSTSHEGTDVLWVGTMSGLDRFDYETETFKNYSIKDGLPHNHITCIEEDDNGNLWITSKIGLTRFDPVNETFKTFWKEDGLPGDGYEMESIHINSNSEVFVGGSKGLVSFYPDSIRSNPRPPNVVLTDLKLFHKTVKVKPQVDNQSKGGFLLNKQIAYLDTIQLPHWQNIITISFSALDFRSPLKNQYAYKLEEFEDEWNYVGATTREATYTNLDHGSYIFRVKGSNNDGIWNEEGTSLRIIISPPWWETQWAFLGYFLVVVGMMVAFWRFQVSRIKLTHQVEMEHLSAEHYHELDEHKSRFMANISHEFRTPLTLILGPVSNLISQIKDQEMRADLSLIQKQAKRLLELVVQLLDISKVDDNRMILQVSQQNIVPLLRGLVLSFGSLAERNKIDLNFESSDENIQIYVERDAMVKILNNLLSNSFKFTEVGNTIIVGVSQNKESLLSKNGEVIIRVSDTGIGIPENHLAKVFDRFHQVDNTETRQWGGTGIGLSLTKELVDLHRGSITVESNTDVGTVFTIRLPLGKHHLAAHEIVHPGNLVETDIQTDTIESDQENSRIYVEADNGEGLPILLIVEDNVDVRNYIRSYLEKSYQCHEAVDGQDGLNKVRELIPDLVISDIMMPKMNGLEFCRHMKTDERTSHIPVLMLTAKADMDSKVKGLETGADAYLTKPFEAMELKIRIKNLIDQRQALRERFQREFSLIPSDLDISSMDRHFLERAVQVISDQLDDPNFKVDNFAQKIFMSRQQVNRKLRALSGRTAVEFIRLIRLKRAAMLLGNNHATITEIAYKVGFSNPSHFSRSFHQEFGKTPSAFLADQKKNNSE
jgi:signal transduction histidine kinase/ligand-binding sensor domain-containing protein/DNA-binding response OmpR family regulator